MKYGVADFLSDTPPPRVMGTEMEYDLQGAGLEADTVISNGGRTFGFDQRASVNHFLPNGGKLYRDCSRIEYATPECLSAEELTLAEHAGRAIVQSVVAASRVTHQGIYDRVASVNYHNQEEDDKTAGYHENYCIPDSEKVIGRMRQYLPTFLVTRTIWSGDGYMSPNGFRVSQKASGMGQELVIGHHSRTVAGEKPLILVADRLDDNFEPTGFELIRCEIRGMDSTHSWFARKLGFAATSLCLRLVETPDDSLRDGLPRLKLPIRSMHEIAKDPTLTKKYAVWGGQEMTAAEIQLAYANAFMRLREKVRVTEEEYEAAAVLQSLTRELVAAPSTGLERFKGRIGWVARLRTLQRHVGSEIFTALPSKAMLLDINWDRLDPHKMGTREISDLGRHAFSHAISPAQLQTAQWLENHAPQGTAANMRAQAFSIYKRRLEGMDWRYIKLERAGRTIRIVFDPYDTDLPVLPDPSTAHNPYDVAVTNDNATEYILKAA